MNRRKRRRTRRGNRRARPPGSAPASTRRAFGSDVVADTLRATRHSLHRAQSGRELSRPARQPRQLSRQRAAADAALPARGERGRDRARLRQGHRQGDGGGGAFQCRADARHDGDLQRLVRPHAGARARRHRSGRRGQAPAVDRLDPHRARPGRAGARLHQMGRPAGLARARRAKRCCAPNWIANTAPRGPVYVNLDAGMQEEKLAEPCRADRCRALHAAGRSAAPTPASIAQAADLLRGAKRPLILAGRVSRSRGGLERARRARRAARRARRHRSQGRRRVPDRPSAACRRAGHHRADAGGRRGDPRGRRDPEPRLGRSRRHAARRVGEVARAKVIQVSVDHQLHNGWSMDYQGLPPVDVLIACEPDAAVPPLLDALGAGEPRAVAAERAPTCRKPCRRQAHRRSHRRPRCATPSATRPASLHASAAVVERRQLAVPPSARLSRLRRRRRRRRRARHLGRRGAGAEGSGRLPVAVCGDGDFLMGVDRALDRGALPHSAADRRRQQSLVLQRRSAPGARRAHAQPAGREQMDRPAHRRSGHRSRRAWRARRARTASARSSDARRAAGACFDEAIAAVEAGARRGRRRARRAGLHRTATDRGDDRAAKSDIEMIASRRTLAGDRQRHPRRRRIVKRFDTPEGAVTAVDDISFGVRQGEFLSVIGPSGCGKSTCSTSSAGCSATTRARVARRRRDDQRPARVDRHGVPGGVDLSLAHRHRERRLPARSRRHAEAAAHRARARTSSSWSGSTASRTAIPASCPAACASASRSPARSPPSRRSC